jgi:hypothetical protein
MLSIRDEKVELVEEKRNNLQTNIGRLTPKDNLEVPLNELTEESKWVIYLNLRNRVPFQCSYKII